MDTIRNFIHVVGITPDIELPHKINGQIIQYSDIETIYIPKSKPAAKSIFQIMIQVEIKSSRMINAPLFRTIVIDGIKRYKIIYTEKGTSENANFLVIDTPYNTFIQLPEEYDCVEKVDVYIIDAYFSLLDSRKIYSYILYLVHAGYNHDSIKNKDKTNDYEPVLENISNVKNDGAKEFDIPVGVMDEMLLSREPETEISLPESPIEISETDDMKNMLVDIDAEYL